ncbi:hypothetical protein G6011_09300 [Alternaria panax]|uniref:Uncharacterized protein n=1 Tax=Alternaria panax TaxID=48097 RepID=A0AAD4NP05_9PLEO|nr:hypothetical protein G6011_09300 [Alternaria panax]
MISLLPRTPSQYTPVDAKVWDMIFLDTKTKVNKKKKKTAAVVAPTVEITAKDIDIRDWSSADRQMLTKGERVEIFISDTLITKISKPLLRETSATFGEIFKDGAIKLPEDTDKNDVVRVVNYLEAIVKVTTKPLHFTRVLKMAESLGVCAAARAFGMDKYTVHLYKKCEALLRQDPPAYEDIDAIIAFKTAHERLFKIVVNSLVKHVWEGTIPDPKDFAAYLAQNPTLDTTIKTAVQKHKYYFRKAEKLTERSAQAEEEQARREAYLKEKAERATKKRDDEKAPFAAKAAKDAALNQSIQKKTRVSEPKKRRFTAQENAYYRRMHSKKPPQDC